MLIPPKLTHVPLGVNSLRVVVHGKYKRGLVHAAPPDALHLPLQSLFVNCDELCNVVLDLMGRVLLHVQHVNPGVHRTSVLLEHGVGDDPGLEVEPEAPRLVAGVRGSEEIVGLELGEPERAQVALHDGVGVHVDDALHAPGEQQVVYEVARKVHLRKQFLAVLGGAADVLHHRVGGGVELNDVKVEAAHARLAPSPGFEGVHGELALPDYTTRPEPYPTVAKPGWFAQMNGLRCFTLSAYEPTCGVEFQRPIPKP
mmetsp:Transcript_18804/g.35818  ORF Transcript_18804/g.35818 Transcript_18804/m.35818 type:complete len:256 (-) Transcript_18804:91-858(-)